MGHCPRGREGQVKICGWLGAKTSPGRYQGLEQRLEAELQVAATSKEEALMELRKRALQLEDELFKVRPPPRLLGPEPTPVSILG